MPRDKVKDLAGNEVEVPQASPLSCRHEWVIEMQCERTLWECKHCPAFRWTDGEVPNG